MEGHGRSETAIAGEWLADLVARAKADGVFAIPIDLTPARAEVLLNRNPDNRNLSETRVTLMARDIQTAAWTFNGEPIIVSDDGWLNDGQHRCWAVVESGMTIRVMLVVGVSRDSRTTVDQGDIKRLAHLLAMEGYQNTTQLAAVASLAWQYDRLGRLGVNVGERPSKSEGMAYIKEHPGVVRSVSACQHRGVRIVGGPAMVALMHWIITRRAGLEAADSFVEALTHGVGLSMGDPILYARNRLIGGRMRSDEKLELLIKAWNAHRDGHQNVRSFQLSSGLMPRVSK